MHVCTFPWTLVLLLIKQKCELKRINETEQHGLKMKVRYARVSCLQLDFLNQGQNCTLDLLGVTKVSFSNLEHKTQSTVKWKLTKKTQGHPTGTLKQNRLVFPTIPTSL